MDERRASNADLRPEVRWGLGCLVATAALLGAIVLVLLIALVLQPPAWAQVLIGLALVGGGALLAWLIASALRQKGPRAGDSPPRGPRRL